MISDVVAQKILRIARTIPRTSAEGPGVRFAIWVQGCSLKCVGCFNPHFWGDKDGVTYYISELVAEIVEAVSEYPEIEGITLLGGEPFDQSVNLAILAARIQGLGLSVMTFTGYRLDELSSDQHGPLLRHTDLLVDGRFEIDNIDTARPWVGSKNQQFHFLTSRYDNSILETGSKDKLEVRLHPNGQVEINGWATSEQLETLLNQL